MILKVSHCHKHDYKGFAECQADVCIHRIPWFTPGHAAAAAPQTFLMYVLEPLFLHRLRSYCTSRGPVAQGRTLSKLGEIGPHLYPQGAQIPPKSPKMRCIQQQLPLYQLQTHTWGVLYCSSIRFNNFECSFEFIGEIGSLVGPITPLKFTKMHVLVKDSHSCVICIPNSSVIGRMLDTLEVRTSLLDPKVYNTPLWTP